MQDYEREMQDYDRPYQSDDPAALQHQPIEGKNGKGKQ